MKIGKRHSQKGAALLVCLLLLLGLTVVGIASMKETITQQQVVNAVAEDDIAFQAAEVALRDGERFIAGYVRTQGEQLSSGGNITFNGQTVMVVDERPDSSTDMANNWWKLKSAGDWSKGAQALTYIAKTGQSPPTFMIEILGEGNDSGSVDLSDDKNAVMNYRVTARGNGASSAYYVVLQSIIGVQL